MTVSRKDRARIRFREATVDLQRAARRIDDLMDFPSPIAPTKSDITALKKATRRYEESIRMAARDGVVWKDYYVNRARN